MKNKAPVKNPKKIKKTLSEIQAECTHSKTYYCLKTGGGRCKKCGAI